MNVDTGEIKPWDELTPEQRTSGKWIKLPPHDTDGHQLATNEPMAARGLVSEVELLRRATQHATIRAAFANIPKREYR